MEISRKNESLGGSCKSSVERDLSPTARDNHKGKPPQHMPGQEHRLHRRKAGDEQMQQQTKKHTDTNNAAILGGKRGIRRRSSITYKPHAALHRSINRRNRANQNRDALGENHHTEGRHQRTLHHIGETLALQQQPEHRDKTEQHRGIAQNIVEDEVAERIKKRSHDAPPSSVASCACTSA